MACTLILNDIFVPTTYMQKLDGWFHAKHKSLQKVIKVPTPYIVIIVKNLIMRSTNSLMHKQMIGEGRHLRTPPRPPDWRSWSSKDIGATHASHSRHRRKRSRLAWPQEPPASHVATTDAVEVYRVSCNRRHHRAWGAPPPLVRLRSAVAPCSPALGASLLLDEST
jgi:hypothetical protein